MTTVVCDLPSSEPASDRFRIRVEAERQPALARFEAGAGTLGAISGCLPACESGSPLPRARVHRIDSGSFGPEVRRMWTRRWGSG